MNKSRYTIKPRKHIKRLFGFFAALIILFLNAVFADVAQDYLCNTERADIGADWILVLEVTFELFCVIVLLIYKARKRAFSHLTMARPGDPYQTTYLKKTATDTPTNTGKKAITSGDVIIYVGIYHPFFDRNGMRDPAFDSFSHMIIRMKKGEKEALDFFFQMLDVLLEKGIAICVVPSSNPRNVFSGITLVARRLALAGREDYTHILRRAKPIRKLSQGGNRALSVHLDSVVVTDPDSVIMKDFLLLDDITTTGNSLVACRQLLVNAGARTVRMMAIAKTVREGYAITGRFKKFGAR